MPKALKPPVRLKTLPSADETRANLDRPDPNAKSTLSLIVPASWKRELKVLSADTGQTMTKLLMRGIELLRKEVGA